MDWLCILGSIIELRQHNSYTWWGALEVWRDSGSANKQPNWSHQCSLHACRSLRPLSCGFLFRLCLHYVGQTACHAQSPTNNDDETKTRQLHICQFRSAQNMSKAWCWGWSRFQIALPLCRIVIVIGQRDGFSAHLMITVFQSGQHWTISRCTGG